ncbi:MAG TPA: M23 family metallopeptidase, partial [Acidimicrobiia bacterium]
GTPVYAPYSGKILQAGWSTTGFGNHIRMTNDPVGTYSILGHLSKLHVEAGMKVAQRQLLGWSGSTGNSTGPHLHLEMRRVLNSPTSAYNFTSSAGAGANVASVAQLIAGIANRASAIAKLFEAINSMPNRPGAYNQLTAHAKMLATKAFKYDQGGEMPPGSGGFANATGKPEKVLTDSQWGAVSQLAGRGGMSMEDLRGVRTSAGMHITVNNTGAVTYDSRNDFSGAQIKVVSNDPDDMARQLEAKATRQRLTSTRGVRVGA